eukprot:3449122-Pyramimonas_sp.AAC.1
MPYAAMYTCYAAWKGPRTCCIQGELAPPLDPCRGLPQGDSTAPCTLTSTLVPWVPTSQGRAFMDGGAGGESALPPYVRRVPHAAGAIGYICGCERSRRHYGRVYRPS